jgi:hypothetical protein
MLSHQRPVLLEPLTLELLVREMGLAAQAERDLDHDGLREFADRKACRRE